MIGNKFRVRSAFITIRCVEFFVPLCSDVWTCFKYSGDEGGGFTVLGR